MNDPAQRKRAIRQTFENFRGPWNWREQPVLRIPAPIPAPIVCEVQSIGEGPVEFDPIDVFEYRLEGNRIVCEGVVVATIWSR